MLKNILGIVQKENPRYFQKILIHEKRKAEKMLCFIKEKENQTPTRKKVLFSKEVKTLSETVLFHKARKGKPKTHFNHDKIVFP